MKNLKRYSTSTEVRDVLTNLFKTEEFQNNLAKEGSLIHRLVEDASKRPLIIYDRDDEALESSHFTTWMGAIQTREYTNPYIHDLYWLHELYHFATMEYNPNTSFAQWHQKMSLNEYDSALVSEAWVYFEMPNLRDNTFDFEIWVDRFLNITFGSDNRWADYFPLKDAVNLMRLHTKSEILQRDPSSRAEGELTQVNLQLRQALHDARIQTMRTPRPWDFLEMQTHTFAMQNMEWSRVWKNSWRDVEQFMYDMHLKHERGDDTSSLHMEWLESKMGASRIPFHAEAVAFKNVLDAIHAKSGNAIMKS